MSRLLAVVFLACAVASASAGGAFDFVPIFHGDVKVGSDALQYKAGCFEAVAAKFSQFDEHGGQIVINAAKPKGLTCSDVYIVATAHQFQPRFVFMRGDHKVNFKWKTEGEFEFVKLNGVQIFEVVGSAWENIKELYDTYEIFNGKKHLAEDNLRFLKDKMGAEYPPRTTENFAIDESLIHSGDQFAVMRLDGLDPMIAFGTGGRTGHTVVCLWMDNEQGERTLYVTESTDKDPFASADKAWPPPYGIIRTPYQQWIKQAITAEYLVNFVPLSDASVAKFDEKKAVEHFKSVEGLPYGYKNFLFGWLDVPKQNMPPPASAEIFLTVLSILNRYKPDVLDLMFNEGMNNRLGTTGLNFNQILKTIEDQQKNFWDVVGLPEMDEWTYSTGKSYVCNVYVTSVYKAAGVFGDLADSIQATEMTPRDTYSLKIYESNWKKDPKCAAEGGQWEYCQFLGKYQMELPEFNSITIYAHMNEKCTNDAREGYRRPEGC